MDHPGKEGMERTKEDCSVIPSIGGILSVDFEETTNIKSTNAALEEDCGNFISKEQEIMRSPENNSVSESNANWIDEVDPTEVSAIICGKTVNFFENFEEQGGVLIKKGDDLHLLGTVIPSSSCITESIEVKKKYYGISFPDGNVTLAKAPLICENKTEALKIIKDCPGARYREFFSYKDAVDYASGILAPIAKTPDTEGKSCPYKAITSNEMATFRDDIINSKEHKFLQSVYGNPRYLINCSEDSPTILQESSRYNALHIAAKSNKPNMCLIILNVIHDINFIKLIYPDENEVILRSRIKRLVDLYLNMPEKVLGETPLHFASKYGASEVLSILLTYRQCDVNKRNKHGKTAKEMVCHWISHYSCDVKTKMLSMFEGLYYVPVLRDIMNHVQKPIVGKCCSSNVVLEAISSYTGIIVDINNRTYSGFFGPMSKDKADELYTKFAKRNKFKDFPFTDEEKKNLSDICLTDSEKGLERVCRIIAKKCDLNWIELWTPISFWGNFQTSDGLKFLEKRLRNQQETMVNLSLLSTGMETRCDAFLKLISNFVEDFMQNLPHFLNQREMPFFLLFQGFLQYIDFMTCKFSFSEDFAFYIHSEIGNFLNLKLKSYEKLYKEFIFYVNKNINTVCSLIASSFDECKEKWSIFLCILNFTSFYSSTLSAVLKPPECKCKWNLKNDEFDFNSHKIYYSIIKLKKAYVVSKDKEGSIENMIDSPSTPAASITKERKIKPILLHFKNCNLDYQVTSSEVLTSSHIIPTEELEENSVNNFLILIDKFCINFRDILLAYIVCIPFNKGMISNIFKHIMPYLQPISEFNYDDNNILKIFHKEIAITLFSKVQYIDAHVLDKWMIYFKSCEFKLFHFDIHREAWKHLYCIIKHFAIVLGNDYETTCCSCKFQTRNETLVKVCHAEFYIDCLKELRNMYRLALKHQMLLPESTCIEDFGTKYFSLPKSPLCYERQIFINGKQISNVDIDIYRSIKDVGAETEISEIEQKRVLEWMLFIESKLGSFLKPSSSMYSHSSTSILKADMSKKRKRHLLVES